MGILCATNFNHTYILHFILSVYILNLVCKNPNSLRTHHRLKLKFYSNSQSSLYE